MDASFSPMTLAVRSGTGFFAADTFLVGAATIASALAVIDFLGIVQPVFLTSSIAHLSGGNGMIRKKGFGL